MVGGLRPEYIQALMLFMFWVKNLFKSVTKSDFGGTRFLEQPFMCVDFNLLFIWIWISWSRVGECANRTLWLIWSANHLRCTFWDWFQVQMSRCSQAWCVQSIQSKLAGRAKRRHISLDQIGCLSGLRLKCQLVQANPAEDYLPATLHPWIQSWQSDEMQCFQSSRFSGSYLLLQVCKEKRNLSQKWARREI